MVAVVLLRSLRGLAAHEELEEETEEEEEEEQEEETPLSIPLAPVQLHLRVHLATPQASTTTTPAIPHSTLLVLDRWTCLGLSSRLPQHVAAEAGEALVAQAGSNAAAEAEPQWPQLQLQPVIRSPLLPTPSRLDHHLLQIRLRLRSLRRLHLLGPLEAGEARAAEVDEEVAAADSHLEEAARPRAATTRSLPFLRLVIRLVVLLSLLPPSAHRVQPSWTRFVASRRCLRSRRLQ